MTEAKDFIAFAQKLKGDEKQEAQTFLNHFFQVFGYEDVAAVPDNFEGDYSIPCFKLAKKYKKEVVV